MHQPTYISVLATLRTVNMSADSIQTTSALLQSLYADSDKATAAVEAWFEACRKGTGESLLPLIYVANDVLQVSCKKLGNRYLELFSAYLVPAFALAIQHAKRTGSAQLRDKVRNVAKILGDRNVYSKKFVINLLTNIERPSATDGDSSSEPPTAALPTSPTTEFVPNNLSSTQNSIKLSSSVLGLKRSSSPTATSPRVGGAPPKKARLKESTAFSIDMGSSLATTTLSSPNGASATSLATTMTAHATAETLFNGSMQEVRTADPRIFKDDGSLEGLYGDELVDQHAACVDVLAHLQLLIPLAEDATDLKTKITALLSSTSHSLQDDIKNDSSELTRIQTMIATLKSVASAQKAQKAARSSRLATEAMLKMKAADALLRKKEKERNAVALKQEQAKIKLEQDAGSGLVWDPIGKKYVANSGDGNATWRDK